MIGNHQNDHGPPQDLHHSPPTTAPPVPGDTHRYINHELSALSYYLRVLEEAQDEANPLLERVKFLSIVGSLLAEFFMVRVARLKQQVQAGETEISPDGLTPAQQLAAIRPMAHRILRDSRECLRGLIPRLAGQNVHVLDYDALGQEQRALVRAYFDEIVFPVLTPLAHDPGRPFPHISNLSMNLAVLVRDPQDRDHFARVKVPKSLPRLVPILGPTGESGDASAPAPQCFVWLEQVIAAHLEALFPGVQVLEAHPFRVTRDAEIHVPPLEAEDLLETTRRSLRQRRFGSVVRVTLNEAMPEAMRHTLIENLDLGPEDLYPVDPPLGMTDLMALHGLDRPDLKYQPFTPVVDPIFDRHGGDVFAAIRERDILLHHPYDSFEPVIDFLRLAARDPDVLAIKQTLYRLGRNPPVVEALLHAAKHGKQVAVLVELQARFDEENNIEWARTLEREGVHVIYGLPGLKTHAKIALVVRKEGDRVRRYTHLASGNYNAITAMLYTDIGLFTCDEDIGVDATELFNVLTGYSRRTEYRKLLVSPVNMRSRLEALIQREIDHQRRGERGHLIFKVNALIDTRMIQWLCRAAQAGVQVDLLARGMCALRPGADLCQKLRVISIVGRFLEHSRIYYFRNGGEEEILLGSADLMPRNLNRRVEILFPVGDARIVRHLRDEVLPVYLADSVKARRLRPDGTYERVRPAPGQPVVDSQHWFIGRGRFGSPRPGIGSIQVAGARSLPHSDLGRTETSREDLLSPARPDGTAQPALNESMTH
ncbi:MAG TPA: polyphosphate kinase 1 [Candidatus Methylomirabilis sp.]|nr:polyphosphate kinase 1 [Candidatus Methylomirabilis sp.]